MTSDPPTSQPHSGETIWILDFGSQYTQLIARRVREQGVFSRVVPCTISPTEIDWGEAKGLIFSGGPASATEPGAPTCDEAFFASSLPKLGICYGLQLYGKARHGRLEQSSTREYGRARFTPGGGDVLWEGLPTSFDVWMSHGDTLTVLPSSMVGIGSTATVPIAAAVDRANNFWGLQFHPEVEHTEHGRDILRTFLYRICNCHGGWNAGVFVQEAIAAVRRQVGNGRVILGVSGGVDSTVLAALMQRAIGDRAYPVLIDSGLLRDDETRQVKEALGAVGVHLQIVDAADHFLRELEDVLDPEQKRKIIGRVFIEEFEAEAHRIGQVDFLAQGTLYPDWIESVSVRGPSATIKSHHNVGGLPETMRLQLVEPLKWLFKDEVREAGRCLELPASVIGRHPFPGPGLAVRILGPVNRRDVDLLRKADRIFIESLHEAHWYDRIWQAFCVLLPVHTVGVMGDERTYERVIAIRAVVSTDGMTADWAEIPPELLKKVSNRIINEVAGINRVVYDVSSKPPATIEWE